MRRYTMILAIVGVLGFAAGQISAVYAGGTPYVQLDCAPVTAQNGVSNLNQGFQTWDEVGYCNSYYLDSSWVKSGVTYYYSTPGWTSYPRGQAVTGASSMFSTHNTFRDWYNGYVGSSTY